MAGSEDPGSGHRKGKGIVKRTQISVGMLKATSQIILIGTQASSPGSEMLAAPLGLGLL